MVKKYRRATEIRLIQNTSDTGDDDGVVIEYEVGDEVQVEVKLVGLTPLTFPGKVTNILDDAIYVQAAGVRFPLRFSREDLDEPVVPQWEGRKAGVEQRKLW